MPCQIKSIERIPQKLFLTFTMLSDFKIHIDIVITQVKMCVQMFCLLFADSKVDMVLRCMYDDVSRL